MLDRAVERPGVRSHRMASGAGHDAMIVAERMPAGMLFLRCAGGISHHPAEDVREEDVAARSAAGVKFLEELGRKAQSMADIDRSRRNARARRTDGCKRTSHRRWRIASIEIAPSLPGAREEIDARGLHVFPGLVDVHLHFNEPGRADWEGAETGSHALAAGGGTLFFDMPLNSTPCTVTAADVDRKRAALEAASITDFGIWGGLDPGFRSATWPEMAERGVVGFKAFMCDSGLPEFPRADEEDAARRNDRSGASESSGCRARRRVKR